LAASGATFAKIRTHSEFCDGGIIAVIGGTLPIVLMQKDRENITHYGYFVLIFELSY
jgi:hypothetical protein